MFRYSFSLLLIACLLGCNSDKELPTVPELDLEKYAGTWYEIARLPNSFEKGLSCVTATYSIQDDGKIAVLNEGYDTEKNEKKSAEGTAWIPDSQFPGRLKVRFFWPFSGDYFILDIDKKYTHVLIGDPSRKYLWVLSKEKKLSDAVYAQLLERAKQHGFKVEDLVLVEQNCAQNTD
jgi:apolipoprotein D and lipocalin family protein